MSEQPGQRTLKTEHKATRKAVTAAAIGNATEWYDFGVYSYLAVTIRLVFYPSQSSGVQLIATFTTFAAAFLVRPLSGMFFGPLGDRIGRKRVLAISFNVSVALFGGTTPLIAESLAQSAGNLYAPAWLVMAAGVVGVWRMKESAGQPLPGTTEGAPRRDAPSMSQPFPSDPVMSDPARTRCGRAAG